MMNDTSKDAMNDILDELRTINGNLRDIVAALVMLQPFIAEFVRWGDGSVVSKIRSLGDIYRRIEETSILQGNTAKCGQ